MDLTALLDRARTASAAAIADEELASRPPGAMTPGQAQEHARLEVDKASGEIASRVANGYLILQEQYRRLAGNPGHETAIPFLDAGFFDGRQDELAARAEEEGEELDLVHELEIDLDHLAAAHDLTQELFGQQRYEDAAAALYCLTLLAPDVPELQRTLGHAEYYCGRIENAIRCYYQAHLCDPGDPAPLLNAAYCLDAVGDAAAAAELRQRAEEIEKELAK